MSDSSWPEPQARPKQLSMGEWQSMMHFMGEHAEKIRELEAKVEQQQQQITTLEERIASLETLLRIHLEP